MTSRQQHNYLNAHTNPRENFKKNFFLKKFRKKATQSMPISETGGPCQYFLPLKISCPKKRSFCDFSVFVLFYGLFRNPVLALPVMYKILSLLGLSYMLYIGITI